MPIYVKSLTINVSVYDSVLSYKNYCDIKLLLMIKINSIKDCKAQNYSVGLRSQKLRLNAQMIRIHKKNSLTLFLALQILFFMPSAIQAAVIVFDRVTTVGSSVYLKVLTKGKFFAEGGKRITFYLEGQQLGKTLTGGDGYGFLKVTPERKGMQEIEVQTETRSEEHTSELQSR